MLILQTKKEPLRPRVWDLRGLTPAVNRRRGYCDQKLTLVKSWCKAGGSSLVVARNANRVDIKRFVIVPVV